MKLSVPFSVDTEFKGSIRNVALIEKKTTRSVTAFSRASHFGLALIPMAIGQVYVQAKDYFDRGPFPEWLGYTGFARTMTQYDYSGWNHFITVMLFALGIGGAIAILRAVGQAEKYEIDRLKEISKE